ncbi:MAG: hypothetical protein H0V89_11680, partial [Deltaproteobacteria bacterium]|nr:hypothetical protein [Deltaproteobacteria bacterium]
MNADDHSDLDLSPDQEAELAAYAAEESKKLGLDREQYVENVQQNFTAGQRPHTT